MKLRCLVIVLAFLAAGASDSRGQSKQPTPPPAEPAQTNQAPKAHERGTEQSPVIVKILPTKESEEKAAADAHREDEKTENDRRLARFTELLFWATGALSVIGLLQLFVFGWQGIQLKRAVSAAKEAADLGNKEFISTHRPRITVYSLAFGGSVADDKLVPISFRYVNSGDSDAKVTGIGSHVFRLTGTMLPGEIQFKHEEIMPPIDCPSGTHGIRLTLDTILPNDVITSGVLDDDKIVCVGYP
jgi:hypothetical protein